MPIFERIKEMLIDRRTWTTMFYFLLMLPLGILYFVIATVGISVSLGLIGGSVATVLLGTGLGGGITLDDNAIYQRPVAARGAFPAGRRRGAPDRA